jgi:hypothetical protein
MNKREKTIQVTFNYFHVAFFCMENEAESGILCTMDCEIFTIKPDEEDIFLMGDNQNKE